MADPQPSPLPPPAPPPTLQNLYGLLPDSWATMLQGNPQATQHYEARQAQREADLEASRQRLYSTISAYTPEPVKRIARGARDYVKEQFTPPPHVEEMRSRLKGMVQPANVAPAGASPVERAVTSVTNVPRGIANFAIDQLADSQTPGDMALNLLPELKAAKGAGALMSALPPGMKLRPGMGSLANALKYVGEGRYAVRDPIVHRLEQLYGHGLSLPRSDWAGSQTTDLISGFGGDADLAHRWARFWGAVSPNTSGPVNNREALSVLAHHLHAPNRLLTVDEARRLPGSKITMAPSKVPNINFAIQGLPLSGDKVEAMASFMTGEPRIPIDVHALWALGSKRTKLDDEIKNLRALMTGAEGLPYRGGLTKTEMYLRAEQAIADALRRIDPHRTLNPLFADLWEGTRDAKRLKPQGGPIDVLRVKGLLEPGAMLDPEHLRDVLRSPGKWTAPLIR